MSTTTTKPNLKKQNVTDKKQQSATKQHDWQKLQQQFIKYKAKDKSKTLKDFCDFKKINYHSACKFIKVKENEQQAENPQTEAEQAGEQETLNYQQKMKVLDGIIVAAGNFIKKSNEQATFKNARGAIETCMQVIKVQIYLEKLELAKQKAANLKSEEEGLVEEEDDSFLELLDAKAAEVAKEFEDEED
jgi:hypothetical protein